MRLSHQQQFELDVLRDIHAEIALKRSTLRAQIERELEKQMTALYARQSRQANTCINAGVSKTKVGRAIGTADWATIKRVLDLTANEFVPEPVEGQSISADYELLDLDVDGSPGAIRFKRYKAASGDWVDSPLTLAFRRPDPNDPIVLESGPGWNKLDMAYQMEVVRGINATWFDAPVRMPVQTEAEFRSRFMVPDDDEDDD